MAQETIISPAPDVQEIAEALMHQYHPELLECRLLYLFTTTAVPCTPRKCNPLLRYGFSLHLTGAPRAAVDEGPDVLLLVNQEDWDYLLPEQHDPYVLHRLLHIGREATTDGGIRWVLVPHPFEEHDEVIQRFGLWNQAAKRLGQIIQPELDLTLPGGEAIEPHQSSITRVTMGAGGESFTATPEDFREAVQRITERKSRS